MKSHIETVHVACDTCGADDTRLVATAIDHEYPDTTDDEFTFVQCTRCNLIYLNPRPAVSELPTIYPPNYFAFDLADTGDAGSKLSVKGISHHFEKRRFRKLLSQAAILDDGRTLSVFDVGCGDGFSLDLFRDVLGPDTLTAGVEMSDAAALRASERGHNVVAGLFEETDLDNQTFDVIFSSHVIEHVASPSAFLDKIHNMLRPDGVVILDTPNVGSTQRKLFGRYWGGWHTPRHWNLYDDQTLTVLAQNRGFTVSRIMFMPINIFWIWGFHSALFARHRKLADALFDPAGISKRGFTGVALVGFFQVVEMAMKLVFPKTAQMRVIMHRSDTAKHGS